MHCASNHPLSPADFTYVGLIVHLGGGVRYKVLDMSYQTDHRSRTKAVAIYLALLFIGAALGFLVRYGIITDHMLW